MMPEASGRRPSAERRDGWTLLGGYGEEQEKAAGRIVKILS